MLVAEAVAAPGKADQGDAVHPFGHVLSERLEDPEDVGVGPDRDVDADVARVVRFELAAKPTQGAEDRLAASILNVRIRGVPLRVEVPTVPLLISIHQKLVR